jgi:hypothetical protein
MVEISILNGLAGGLVATIVMTAFMLALGDDSPPPTALFWSQYVGDGPPSDYMPQGMALHMIYGIVAGAVFALVVPMLGLGLSGTVGLTALGLAYGFVLFVGAAVFWMNVVLDIDAEPAMVGMFLFFHLVYGAVLGAWISLGLV